MAWLLLLCHATARFHYLIRTAVRRLLLLIGSQATLCRKENASGQLNHC